MDGEQKKKRFAIEPNEWLGVDKICPRCQSTRYKFKYLNNRKHDQPRYLCLDCKKFYGLHAQKGARRPHPGGYTKRKIKTDMLKNLCPNSGRGGNGFKHMLPNGEPSDKPTTSECLACGPDCHAILPKQHTRQLREDYHTIPHQNLVNYSDIFDQMATSNGPTIIEEPNISLDIVEDHGHNVDLEKENLMNVFDYTYDQLGDFLEEPKNLRNVCEILSQPFEDVPNFTEFT